MTHPDRAIEAGARVLCSEMTDNWLLGREYWRSVMRAILSALAAEGLVVVPVEPSTKMICAALDDYDKRGRGKQSYCDIYAAMLAAAAQEPTCK